jgi:hypothetical protein
MFKPLLRAAAPVLLLTSVPLAARLPQPIAAADTLRHLQLPASDQPDGAIETAGAVQDADLPVAPGRRLADPAAHARPQRTAE